LHEYAAAKMIGIVQSKFAPETAVALAGYVLGEFGVNICERVCSLSFSFDSAHISTARHVWI
jgi:hypothetical protein